MQLTAPLAKWRLARSIIITMAVCALVSLPMSAQMPRTVPFQGVLANNSGIPKPNGTYNVTFSLYDAGNNLLWTETNKPVTVAGGKGVFSTSLGTSTSLGGLPFDRPYYLEVQVSGDPPMTPRFPLQSVPYALHADTASNLTLPFSGSLSGTNSIGITIQNYGSGGGGFRAVTDSGRGLWATTNGSYGVFAEALTTGTGVQGKAVSGIGVIGFSDSGHGVYGQSSSGAGTVGISTSWIGVYGESGSAFGVNGKSASNSGVYGQSTSGLGVYGTSATGAGVQGESLSNGAGTGSDGVVGIAHVPGKAGVRAQNDAPGAYGVYASAQGAGSLGVVGTASGDASSKGVFGSTLGGYGVWGEGDSTGGIGVHGQNSAGAYGELGTAAFGGTVGAYGQAPGGASGGLGVSIPASANFAAGVYGQGTAGQWAGYFVGDVYILGHLSATGGKNFMIDHPLDPANRYLVYTSAEGPEALNIYSGNVTTDANGQAVVDLPSHFEAENRDFRYQLTIVDDSQFAQARVSQKVQNNRFVVRTDKPGIEVSWQVTGVRNDAYVRTHPQEVEPMKAPGDRGRYLSPESFGKPDTMRIGYSASAVRTTPR